MTELQRRGNLIALNTLIILRPIVTCPSCWLFLAADLIRNKRPVRFTAQGTHVPYGRKQLKGPNVEFDFNA